MGPDIQPRYVVALHRGLTLTDYDMNRCRRMPILGCLALLLVLEHTAMGEGRTVLHGKPGEYSACSYDIFVDSVVLARS